jgi:predicted N-acyltransferase
VADGIDIVALSGDELTEEHWDAFFHFYMDTGSRKWGRPYLNRDFFRRLHATMADRVVLVMARRKGRWIAGAWNMRGGDVLYGRNWGCIEYHPCLHFECCYYQAIEYAIRHGLKRVEAGAQGEHKLARGYLPTPIYSVHWLADPRFQDAVARYLKDERAYMTGLIQALDEHSPFRQVGPPPETE